MKRHEFLAGMHERLRPRSYVEIGVNDGRSLALSRARSIAIDPAFKVTAEIHCEVDLVKATSDDFFATADPVARLPDRVIDMAFIDGLHIFEYALRDFRNVERYASWTSVIVLDDMLPRSVSEAARDRHTVEWTGDVFKVAEVLRRYRPDLTCLALDTQPTGLLVVLGADPNNRMLWDHYEDVVAEFVAPDPQHVPDAVLQRKESADPHKVLESDLWQRLVRARQENRPRDPDLLDAPRQLAGTGPASPVIAPSPVPWPPVKAPPTPPPKSPEADASEAKPPPQPTLVPRRQVRPAWRRAVGKAAGKARRSLG